MMRRHLVRTALALLGTVPFTCALAAQVTEVRLDHLTARPLAEAADLLENKYGWIVTYEDMPVVGTDVQDITARQRPLTPDQPFRILIPRTGNPVAFMLDE